MNTDLGNGAAGGWLLARDYHRDESELSIEYDDGVRFEAAVRSWSGQRIVRPCSVGHECSAIRNGKRRESAAGYGVNRQRQWADIILGDTSYSYALPECIILWRQESRVDERPTLGIASSTIPSWQLCPHTERRHERHDHWYPSQLLSNSVHL